jgi:flagellar basal body-associated protein FliL
MSDPEAKAPKGGEDPQKGAVAEKPSKKKRLVLFGGAGIVLGGGLAVAAAFLGWIQIPGVSFSEKAAQAAPKPVIDVGPMIKLSPLIINLSEAGSRHYLKTTLVLEIGRKDWLAEVQGKMTSLTDMVIVTLGDKRLADLRKSEARENVRKELLEKANQILAGEKIRRIYFDEFLFQ